jgi:hypothetical protein
MTHLASMRALDFVADKNIGLTYDGNNEGEHEKEADKVVHHAKYQQHLCFQNRPQPFEAFPKIPKSKSIENLHHVSHRCILL